MKFPPPPFNPVIPVTSLPARAERLAVFPIKIERQHIVTAHKINLIKKPKCLR